MVDQTMVEKVIDFLASGMYNEHVPGKRLAGRACQHRASGRLKQSALEELPRVSVFWTAAGRATRKDQRKEEL